MAAGVSPESMGQSKIRLDSWHLSPDWIAQYLAAVGDCSPAYAQTGLAPPLALAARTLGMLLQKLSLPQGPIHSLQELDTLRPIKQGVTVAGDADLEQPRRRGNLEFRRIVYKLADQGGQSLASGKTTVLRVHGGPVEAAGSESSGNSVTQAPAASGLPVVARTVSQSQLDAYSRVSGDYNPLHWDPAFAATTQFDGIIAHGMLTLAFISEMMLQAFGRPWLEQGAMSVRFKGAARVNSPVETWGSVVKESALAGGRQVTCSVGLRHSVTGQELIGGTAKVMLAEARQ
ncbi:MAG: hypothetical protein FJ316_03525 [SAR202 cluster bacterium]|nr:hypothetical protein [SAR202 cluster bacterium]